MSIFGVVKNESCVSCGKTPLLSGRSPLRTYYICETCNPHRFVRPGQAGCMIKCKTCHVAVAYGSKMEVICSACYHGSCLFCAMKPAEIDISGEYCSRACLNITRARAATAAAAARAFYNRTLAKPPAAPRNRKNTNKK
jgi:hypothetical protein